MIKMDRLQLFKNLALILDNLVAWNSHSLLADQLY